MKKIIFPVCTAILLIFLLASCGISPPSEEQLSNMIPSDVIYYTIDGEVSIPDIESCTLLRRQTNEKEDYAECDIVLRDQNLVRQLTLGFSTTYYDVGGWQLDNCFLISEEDQEILLRYDLEKLKQYLENQGYILGEDLDVENYSGEMFYLGAIETQEHENLILSGTVEAHTKLIRCQTNYLTPLDFEWTTDIFPNIQSQWNIDGPWYGEPLKWSPNNEAMVYYSGEPKPYYVSLTDNTFDGKKCSGVIEAKYDRTNGGIGTYKPQQYECDAKIEGHSINDMCLSFSAYGGYDSFKLYFYADDAYITKVESYHPESREYPVPLKRT